MIPYSGDAQSRHGSIVRRRFSSLKPFHVLSALVFLYAARHAYPATAVLQNSGVTQDTTLYSDSPEDNAGGSEYFFVGLTYAGGYRRTLIRFNLSSIPYKSTITSAALSLFLSRTPDGGPETTESLYRVTSSWAEGRGDSHGLDGQGGRALTGAVSWLWRQTAYVYWNAPGGDYDYNHPKATVVVPRGYNFTLTWTDTPMISDLQDWLTNPDQNFGWMIRDDFPYLGDARRFASSSPYYSSTPSLFPTLTIQYDPPTTMTVPQLDNTFPTAPDGWQQFGSTNPTQSTQYLSTGSALLANVTPTAQNNWRIIGWITKPDNVMPYSVVGSDHFIRAKYYIYASGQTGHALNEVPNFRVRVASRFAVSSILVVNNHTAVDPAASLIAHDIRPSTNTLAPSVYRADLDPPDVPQLVSNPATEGFLRAFEIYEPDPQANGSIAMTECIVGTYPALPDYATTVPVTQNGLIKRYLPGPNGGDFGNGNLSVSNSIASIGKYFNGALETTGSLPTFAVSESGITLETLSVESNRLGVIAFDVFNAPEDQTNRLTRARIEQHKQYKIRFHATSTVATNTQAVVRFRAKTINFQYSAMMEIGGATGASTQSNTIAQQALPGLGNQMPPFDRINPFEHGGWYNVLMVSPMDPSIQWDQPRLYAQDPPGVNTGGQTNSKSRRDIQFGFDIIDTFNTQPTSGIEAGQMTVDRVEIEKYDLVPD